MGGTALGAVLAAVISGGSSNAPPSLQPVEEAMRVMSLPGLAIDVQQIPCGQVNAAYMPRPRLMLVCNELLEQVSPAVVRAVIAHEMAHVIIDQYHVPITGSGEVAADELSAVMMSRAGYQTDILQAAVLLEEWSLDPTYRENIYDDHPGLARRAYTLMCLEDGSEPMPNDPDCGIRFKRAAHNWDRLLALHQIAE